MAEIIIKAEVLPKRPFDAVPIEVDWHDYLARLWRPGAYYTAGDRIRFKRAQSKGWEFLCVTSGLTGGNEPLWPRSLGVEVQDGSARWRCQTPSSSSFRTNIVTATWPAVAGISYLGESIDDLVYTQIVDAGTAGTTYSLIHRITLLNGEEKEALILLPVRDT